MSETRTAPDTVFGLPVRSLRVEVVRGPDLGAVFTTGSDRVSVGAAAANDLVLNDGLVSRHHLELRSDLEGVSVTDLGSTNGTIVGAVRISAGVVRPGAAITLGNTTLKVDDGAALDAELHDDERLGPMVGVSTQMRQVMAKISRAAGSDASVLVLGETGVGKEVAARALHTAGPRASAPFETVDCAAQLPDLIGSELFGHERGAFTGALSSRAGAFERANGGTLFLDEIGELPLSLQPMLLGALERRSFRRLGGSTPISVDVRVVCASNRDLREEVNAGAFREDLFYRVAVIKLHLPPLRDRLIDIPGLVDKFLQEAGREDEYGTIITDDVLQELSQHRWPGNVRELKNYVEALVAMGEGPALESRAPDHEAADPASDAALNRPWREARSAVLEQFEVRYLTSLLDRAGGNVSEASRVARMNRGYLNQLLARHNLRYPSR